MASPQTEPYDTTRPALHRPGALQQRGGASDYCLVKTASTSTWLEQVARPWNVRQPAPLRIARRMRR